MVKQIKSANIDAEISRKSKSAAEKPSHSYNTVQKGRNWVQNAQRSQPLDKRDELNASTPQQPIPKPTICAQCGFQVEGDNYLPNICVICGDALCSIPCVNKHLSAKHGAKGRALSKGQV